MKTNGNFNRRRYYLGNRSEIYWRFPPLKSRYTYVLVSHFLKGSYWLWFLLVHFVMKDSVTKLTVLATVVRLQILQVAAEHHVKCEQTYEKLGCFDTYQNRQRVFSELIVTDRDPKAPQYGGIPIDWYHWDDYLQGLACRCIKRLDKLAAGNLTIYKQFALENYGECWSSKTIHHDSRQLKKSEKCVGEDFSGCKNDSDSECAGTGITSFLYEINRREEFIPDHCHRVTLVVCASSTNFRYTLRSVIGTETSTSQATVTEEAKSLFSQANSMDHQSDSNYMQYVKSTTEVFFLQTDSAVQRLQTLNTGGLFTPGKIPRNVTLAPTLHRARVYLTSKGSQNTAVKSEVNRHISSKQTLSMTQSSQIFNTQGFLTLENILGKITTSPIQGNFSHHERLKELESTAIIPEITSDAITLKTGRLTSIATTLNTRQPSSSENILTSTSQEHSRSHRYVAYQSTSSGLERIPTKPRQTINSSLLETGRTNETLQAIPTAGLFSPSKTLLGMKPTSTHESIRASLYSEGVQKILPTLVKFTKTTQKFNTDQFSTSGNVRSYFHLHEEHHTTKTDLTSESREGHHYATVNSSPQSYERYHTTTMNSFPQSYEVYPTSPTTLISDVSSEESFGEPQTTLTLSSNPTYVNPKVTPTNTNEQVSQHLFSHSQHTTIAPNAVTLKTGSLAIILTTLSIPKPASTTDKVFQSVTSISLKHPYIVNKSTPSGQNHVATKLQPMLNSTLLKTMRADQTLQAIKTHGQFSPSKTLVGTTSTSTRKSVEAFLYTENFQKILHTSELVSFTKSTETLNTGGFSTSGYIRQEKNGTPTSVSSLHLHEDHHTVTSELSPESRELHHYTTVHSSLQAYEMFNTPTLMDSSPQSYEAKHTPTKDLISDTSRQESLSKTQTAKISASNHRLRLTYVNSNITFRRTNELATQHALHSQQITITSKSSVDVTSSETRTVIDRIYGTEFTSKAILHSLKPTSSDEILGYKQTLMDKKSEILKSISTLSVLLQKTITGTQIFNSTGRTQDRTQSPGIRLELVSADLEHSLSNSVSPERTYQQDQATLTQTVNSSWLSVTYKVPQNFTPVFTESPSYSSSEFSKRLLQSSIKLQTRTATSRHQAYESLDLNRTETKHIQFANLPSSVTGLHNANKLSSAMQLSSSKMLNSIRPSCVSSASSLSCIVALSTILHLVTLLS